MIVVISCIKDNYLPSCPGIACGMGKMCFDLCIGSCIKSSGFSGEKSETKSIFTNSDFRNIILVGLGEEEKYTPEVLMNIVADMAKRLRDGKIENFSLWLDSFKGSFQEEDLIEKITMGCLIGL